MQLSIFNEIFSTGTPLSYPGGKKKLWSVFRSYLPSNIKDVTSPFIGGGSIELKCTSVGLQVQASDNFEPLINFWNTLLTDPNGLVDEMLSVYPVTKDQRNFHHKTALKKGSKNEDGSKYSDMQRAALFWCLNKQGFNSLTLAQNGYMPHPITIDYIEKWRTWSNPNISISLSDCFPVIEQAKSFMYLDPPYIGMEHYYGADKEDSSFDHERLCSLLKETKNPWIMSYGDHPIIREMYKDFKMLVPKWKYGSRAQNAGKQDEQGLNSKELLILNLKNL